MIKKRKITRATLDELAKRYPQDIISDEDARYIIGGTCGNSGCYTYQQHSIMVASGVWQGGCVIFGADSHAYVNASAYTDSTVPSGNYGITIPDAVITGNLLMHEKFYLWYNLKLQSNPSGIWTYSDFVGDGAGQSGVITSNGTGGGVVGAGIPGNGNDCVMECLGWIFKQLDPKGTPPNYCGDFQTAFGYDGCANGVSSDDIVKFMSMYYKTNELGLQSMQQGACSSLINSIMSNNNNNPNSVRCFLTLRIPNPDTSPGAVPEHAVMVTGVSGGYILYYNPELDKPGSIEQIDAIEMYMSVGTRK